MWGGVAVAVMLGGPGAVTAQVESMKDFQVADVADLFPGMWGATPPDPIGEGFGGEMGWITSMSKSEIIAELNNG